MMCETRITRIRQCPWPDHDYYELNVMLGGVGLHAYQLTWEQVNKVQTIVNSIGGTT